ncbi:MAG: hypothetical protein JWO08_2335 [Verrucomicrobiaceae bacterium]|nr:hypothetical protein [Verrucomicrobiaceae bacterium]
MAGLLSFSVAQAKPINASTEPVRDEPPVTVEDREHWAFKVLQRPEVPKLKNPSLARNDVDRFTLAKLEATGQTLREPADPATLLRRVTFDLTGLPPSQEDVQSFIKDHSDKAFETYVDKLLGSIHYGERWAQHWLDLARYAETDGFEYDAERRHAFKYRDWVIEALNKDLPFDEFVREQIAGDEMSPPVTMATGFLMAGPDMPDINLQKERRHVVLNDITTTVGSAFLGVTIGCAQCHDHPYDPLSQADFYRLRAFFDNAPEMKLGKQLDPAFVEASITASASHVNIRGDFQRPGPEVEPAFPRIANPEGKPVAAVPKDKSTGRRLALAQWLTQPTNGLFLRASVNRLWQHHFGRPMAGIPNDLGHQGEAPTHPELLEWLASELPRQNWSVKAMHRLIVLSATYRQSSLPTAQHSEGDHYALFPRRRLSGEELRDAMLAVAGQINMKPGGASVRLPLPPEVSSTLLKQQQQVSKDPQELKRRSIYTFARRNLRHPLFEIFDRPDALMSCGRRNESTTAPQALMLFNSEFSLGIAKAVAALVKTGGTDAASVVTNAVWRCYSRAPTAKELELGKAFLERQTSLTSTFEEAVQDYCLALINGSAFCYVD